MRSICAASALLVFAPTLAFASGESRELGAHEHGSGALNIAVEGTRVAMEFEAPGADIVGFEYAAESDADRAAIDTAISDLARPLDWFVFPPTAGCAVIEASVALVGEDDHDDHEHEHDHAEDDDDHDEHASEEHSDHDHDHDEHAEEAGAEHTEFHAEYVLDCASPEEITAIDFAYFERFPNALELEVQVASDAGANLFEVERDTPVLDLGGMF